MNVRKRALAVASVIGLALLLAGFGMTFNAAVVAAPDPIQSGDGHGNMALSLDGGNQPGANDSGEGSVPDVDGGPGYTGNHIYLPTYYNYPIKGHPHHQITYPQESGLPDGGDNGTLTDNDGNTTGDEEPEACTGDCGIIEVPATEDPCNGFEPSETSCGIGACASTGITSCSDGEITDSCAPLAPSDEICSDGIDNNCDGYADCADESCVQNEACIGDDVEETPPAPEFMFVVIPVGIIALMLAFSYMAAKGKK